MNGIDSIVLDDILETVDSFKNQMLNGATNRCPNSRCLGVLKDKTTKTVKRSSLKNHWGKIVDTVSVAPKEELAQMAETLVHLTFFRRQLSIDLYSQSVGGPIDVDLITKGDGFIWIRRKFYFHKELNYHFFALYLPLIF